MKKISVKAIIGILVSCLMTACSIDSDKNENTSSDRHTYQIEIAGGKTYQGSVPKEAGNIYYPVSFVQYSEEISSKILTGMLQEAGKFQFGIGLALDANNKPSLRGSGPGLAFGEWGSEEKYGPVGNISMTLKNYKEHSIYMYGEEATVASYTLTFSGKFKIGTAGEEVDVIGELVVEAP